MKIGLGVVVVLVLGYMFATPYITAYQMKTAGESRDGEALSEHVDFPALRQNLKDQLNVILGKEMAKEVEDNPLAVFGVAFGGVIVEKLVDAYVTPVGITELMKGKKPDSDNADGDTTRQTSSEPFSDVSMSYESFSKFTIATRDSESGEEMKFILRRRGMNWKLAEIMLPL